MEPRLSDNEINEIQQLLQDYNPAQEAITLLSQNNGKLDTTFDQLWEERNNIPAFGEGKSLWQSTLKVIRQELCGDDGFRAQFQEYTRNPGSAPLLTGLIVSLTTLSGLPIDPAIATIVILYLLKVGLKVFCEYTEQEQEDT